MLLQQLKDHSQVHDMIIQGSTINQYIIEEHNDKFLEVFMKDSIHKRLKQSKGIFQLKWHHQVLKVARMGSKCSLKLLSSLHSKLVISNAQSQHRIHRRTLEFIKEIINQRNWEAILDGL